MTVNNHTSAYNINPIALLDPQDDGDGIIHVPVTFPHGVVKPGDEYTACIKILVHSDNLGDRLFVSKGPRQDFTAPYLKGRRIFRITSSSVILRSHYHVEETPHPILNVRLAMQVVFAGIDRGDLVLTSIVGAGQTDQQHAIAQIAPRPEQVHVDAWNRVAVRVDHPSGDRGGPKEAQL